MGIEIYESSSSLVQYLLMHYGAAEQVLPYSFGPVEALDFPVRCVSECVSVETLPPDARALDLGCALGRSSFELAAHCREVVGIDFSERFIKTAKWLANQGEIEFYQIEEGWLTRPVCFVVPEHLPRGRVTFEVGDAMHLRPNLGSFDVVLIANLIDRLTHPLRCLQRLQYLVRKGGQLIITSPYTWSQNYTKREEWLGGYEQDGKPVRTLETLKAELEPHFKLRLRKDMPFLIREHARKYQWSVADATIWVRK